MLIRCEEGECRRLVLDAGDVAAIGPEALGFSLPLVRDGWWFARRRWLFGV